MPLCSRPDQSPGVPKTDPLPCLPLLPQASRYGPGAVQIEAMGLYIERVSVQPWFGGRRFEVEATCPEELTPSSLATEDATGGALGRCLPPDQEAISKYELVVGAERLRLVEGAFGGLIWEVMYGAMSKVAYKPSIFKFYLASEAEAASDTGGGEPRKFRFVTPTEKASKRLFEAVESALLHYQGGAGGGGGRAAASAQSGRCHTMPTGYRGGIPEV